MSSHSNMDKLMAENDAAVSLMQAKLYEEAAEVLTKGLRSLTTFLRERKDEQMDMASPKSGLKFDFVQGSKHSFTKSDVRCRTLCGGCGASKIFSLPTVVNFYECESLSIDDDTERMTYPMLFNLAICYHLKAISSSDSTAADFRKTLALYEKAFQIISNLGMEVPVMHHLALFNNVAAVHAYLGNEANAQACYQRLLALLMYLMDANPEYAKNQLLQGFLRIVMPMIQQIQVAPAA